MNDQAQGRISQGCKYHPPLPAKVFCRECNAPLCSICSKFVDGKFLCEECVAAGIARKLAATVPSATGSIRVAGASRPTTRGVPLEAHGNAAVVLEAPIRATPAGGIPVSKPATSVVVPGMPAPPGAKPSGAVPLGSVRFDQQVTAAHPATGVPNVAPGQKTAFLRSSQEALVQSRRISSRKYSCKNHPGIEAELRCDLCGSVFCADCVKETRHKRLLCHDCARPGGRSALTMRTSEFNKPQIFSNRLAEAFLSPLLAERKYLLLVAPAALWLGFLAHWAAGMFVVAYMTIWLMKITRRAAQNAEDKSTHPSFEDSTNDIVKPFFMALLAVLLLLLPLLIYVPLGHPDILRKGVNYLSLVFSGETAPDAAHDPEKLLQYITSHASADAFIMWALLAAALLLPLCLGMLGLFGRSDVLSPPMLATALSRLAAYYALILALFAAAFLPTWYVVGVMKEFSGGLGLLCGLLITYFSMVAFRIFGDVYLCNKGLFEFYGRPLVEG